MKLYCSEDLFEAVIRQSLQDVMKLIGMGVDVDCRDIVSDMVWYGVVWYGMVSLYGMVLLLD